MLSHSGNSLLFIVLPFSVETEAISIIRELALKELRQYLSSTCHRVESLMKAKGIEKVLVTGGAGFIGSHTVDALTESGYDVTVLDSLEPQVHGPNSERPDYLSKAAEFVRGDILDSGLLERLIKEPDAIIHLAAMVGVGQSMYQIERYIDTNTRGTSHLLDLLVNKENHVRKLLVASSMSVYGEGKYWCEVCRKEVYPAIRVKDQLDKNIWEHLCPSCQSVLKPIPTAEDKPLAPTSIYAMSKRHQEEETLLIGSTYGLPSVALRYFNVYGPRQSLSNPYTGACAIFLSRILNNSSPYIFEDGKQLRDFINVKDIARANRLALESSSANGVQINIGTGKPFSILDMANILLDLYGKSGKLKALVSKHYRKGDVRHCFADVQRAKNLLGFEAEIPLRDGLLELVDWGKSHGWGALDLFEKSLQELKQKRLST